MTKNSVVYFVSTNQNRTEINKQNKFKSAPRTDSTMASSSGGFTASEVSRLVMGHLKTMNCNETSEKFVEECPPELQLAQFSALVQQGILRTFDVDGLSLVDILNEYKE